jgi:glycerol transport system ATP-binding protein
MRLMAGLDVPTSGSVWFDGQNVTGMPVQKRKIAMVYQQFINYPAMTVYENIASPLRVAGIEQAKIDSQVREAAALLKLTPYLDRTPLNLSGGQQQRTALARAIVKNASLVLLDEPLANLDYKLREELRAELPRIFAAAGTIFVYATTEPHEALLLGGNTATLSEGQITQFGPTIDVFRKPVDLVTAKTFADPPLNTIVLAKKGADFLLEGGVKLPVPPELVGIADANYTVGFQPHHLSLERPNALAVPVRAKVTITEITGSESFIHLDFADARWVMLSHGILDFEPDDAIDVFIDPRHIMVFDEHGRAVTAPKLAA